MVRYVCDEDADKGRARLHREGWTFAYGNCPAQTDGHSCGILLLMVRAA